MTVLLRETFKNEKRIGDQWRSLYRLKKWQPLQAYILACVGWFSISKHMILNSGIWIQNHRKWFWIQGFEFKIAEYDIEFRDLNSKSQNLSLNSVIWIQNHRLWCFEFRDSVVWIQGHNRLQAQILLLSWKFMIGHHIIHMCSCSVWYTCKVLVYTSPVECSHVITACKWWAAANGSGKPVYHWRHYFGWWWRCSSHRFCIWCTSQMGITMYTSHLHIAFQAYVLVGG